MDNEKEIWGGWFVPRHWVEPAAPTSWTYNTYVAVTPPASWLGVVSVHLPDDHPDEPIIVEARP